MVCKLKLNKERNNNDHDAVAASANTGAFLNDLGLRTGSPCSWEAAARLRSPRHGMPGLGHGRGPGPAASGGEARSGPAPGAPPRKRRWRAGAARGMGRGRSPLGGFGSAAPLVGASESAVQPIGRRAGPRGEAIKGAGRGA